MDAKDSQSKKMLCKTWHFQITVVGSIHPIPSDNLTYLRSYEKSGPFHHPFESLLKALSPGEIPK